MHLLAVQAQTRDVKLHRSNLLDRTCRPAHRSRRISSHADMSRLPKRWTVSSTWRCTARRARPLHSGRLLRLPTRPASRRPSTPSSV